MSQRPAPTPEQRRAAEPDTSVWVAANAGSGKTQVLVDRVIRLMLAGADPQTILCLTFTKAAAAEMSARLFKRLGGWIALDDAALGSELVRLGIAAPDATHLAQARRLFARALETPGGLKIQTIHAFCERLLQLFPVEAGLAPGFRVMDDRAQAALLRAEFLAALGRDDEVAQAVWSFLSEGDVTSLDGLIDVSRPYLSGASGLRQRLSAPGGLATILQHVAQALGVAPGDETDDSLQALSAIDVDQYLWAAEALRPFPPTRKHDVAGLLTAAARAAPEQRHNLLLALFGTSTGTPRKDLVLAATRKAVPDVVQWLEDEQARVFDTLNRLALQQIHTASRAVYIAMAGVLAQVTAEKRRRGLYDFDDLIARAAALLANSEAAQWVLHRLDRGLNHILVDEAQDTSPAQWRIISALADEFFAGAGRPVEGLRTMFAVGDRKQSIYSFQGADTGAFEAAHARFKAQLAQVEQKLADIDLTVSFRTTRTVLEMVDRVFARGSAARRGFGQRADDERDHTAHRSGEGVVELWPLVVPEYGDTPDYWRRPVDEAPQDAPRRRLAQQIARTIHSWLGRRLIVARGRTVQPGDILVLLQRRTTLVFPALIAELRRLGIPVAGADKLKLGESLATQDLLMLGQAMRLPQDDHALACVLKSPLVPEPVSEDNLIALCAEQPAGALWLRVEGDAGQAANAAALRQYRAWAEVLGPFDFFARVIQRCRTAILARLGSEADDAMAAFLDLALAHEQQQGLSLPGFMDWFAEGETVISRQMEQDAGEVRIMTVHGAKGLEAPIVILADAADPPETRTGGAVVPLPDDSIDPGLPVFVPRTTTEPERIHQWKTARKEKNRQERMRLLYVAMTRAADELYVCGSQNVRKLDPECWYSLIRAAADNGKGDLPRTETREGLTGDVLCWGAPAAWFDEVQPASAAELSLPAWAVVPAAAPAVNASRAQSVVALAQGDGRLIDRAAARRGVALHRLLEALATLPPAQRATAARRRGTQLGLTEADVDQVLAVMAQQDLAPFFGPDSHGEVALRGDLPGLGDVSGRIDRMVQDADGIAILDYKSDRQVPATLAAGHPHVRQMGLYAALLAAAYPGRAVRAALLWTQTGQVDWLAPDLLSQAVDQARHNMP